MPEGICQHRAFPEEDMLTSIKELNDSGGARSLELASIFHECLPGRRKLAVKVVDIFGNDTMKIVEVSI